MGKYFKEKIISDGESRRSETPDITECGPAGILLLGLDRPIVLNKMGPWVLQVILPAYFMGSTCRITLSNNRSFTSTTFTVGNYFFL